MLRFTYMDGHTVPVPDVWPLRMHGPENEDGLWGNAERLRAAAKNQGWYEQ